MKPNQIMPLFGSYLKKYKIECDSFIIVDSIVTTTDGRTWQNSLNILQQSIMYIHNI